MRWAVGILAAGLIVGFVLCAVSDLNFSDILKESGIMALGFSWMIGYSLHGVAVVAVPILFLVRNKTTSAKLPDRIHWFGRLMAIGTSDGPPNYIQIT